MGWIDKTPYPNNPGVSFQEMIQLNNGLVLVVGGEHLFNTTTDVLNPNCYLYDPVGNTWTLTGALHTLRVTPNLVKLNDGRILCVGGRDAISNGNSLTSTEIFDPNTNLWTITGSLNVGRYRPAIWLLNTGDVLIAGGLTGSPGFTPVASSEIYSVSGGTWGNASHDLPQTGAEFYFFSLPNGTPLICSGQNGGSGFDGSYTYNLSTGWNFLSSNPTGLESSDIGRILQLSNGDFMLTGAAINFGGSVNHSSNACWIFHISGNTWEQVGNLNTARQDVILGALPNGAAFISGGFTYPYSGILTGELYDPVAKTWSFNSAYNLPTQQTFALYVPTVGTNVGVFAIGGWDVTNYPSSVVTVANNRFQLTGGSTPVANGDTSSYTLRWNEILGHLEYSAGLSWLNTGVATSAGITQLTGDVTAGPGSGSQAATLATVNSNVGSFTSANITVNAKGLITAASNGSGGGFNPTPSVQTITQANTSTSSTTYVTTALTNTFALSNSSHKVKVSVSGDMQVSAANDYGFITIFRDGVDIVTSSPSAGRGVAELYGGFASAVLQTVGASYLDSPGNTASHTYTIRVKSLGGANTVQFPAGNCNSILILEEVI